MEAQQTIYRETGKWYSLSSEKSIVLDGADVVVLLGKKRKEFARVRKDSLVDVVPVLDTESEYDVYYPHFKLADESTTPVFREGSNKEERVRMTCGAIKKAIGIG